MKNLEGTVFVVTGAGSGIGRALAHELLSKGVTVAAVDANAADLAATMEEAKVDAARISAHVVDVTDRQAIDRLVKEVRSAHGAVDGLINNAGITNRPTLPLESNYQDFRKIMEVNFWGVVNMTMAFLPELLTRPAASLVNVSSGGGILGFMGLREYCASKWAVRGYTECLRADLFDSVVVVSCVHPGKVLTNLTRHTIDLTDEQREAAHTRLVSAPGGTTPASAAKIIVAGIEAENRRILVGGDVKLMDRIGRLFPIGYTKLLHKPMKAMVDSARPN